MHSTTLIALCVVMTLGMALAMYDSGSYGYSYVPYHAPQSGSGIGEGGLREYIMGRDVRKPVFGVSDKTGLKHSP